MTDRLATLLLAAGERGEQTPLDLDTGGAQAAAGGGSIVRTVVGLAVVLAVIYGLHWVLKQVKSSREGRAAGDGLTAVASLPLGANRSLHVVRAGREVLVLGSAEHGVTPLRVYGEDEARAAGLIGWDDAPAQAWTADGAAAAFPAAVEGIAAAGRPPAGSPALTPQLPARRPPLALPAPREALDTLRAWTVRG